MVQANRGTKRRCTSCGAPYYDLNRDPVICPKCETPYQPRPAAPLRAFRGPMRVGKPRPIIEEPKPEEAEDTEAFAEDEVLPVQEDEDETETQIDDEEV